ncbi:MAG: DUF4270 family protein, partial [Cyclobacteriaceae bacterium]
VLAVALFFFSCEDETSILGFKNPNKRFQVGFVDIPLNTSSILVIDSLITDLRPIVINGQINYVDGILVGQYQDNQFGKIEAKSFLTIVPISTTAFDANAVYDSITVQFRMNFHAYGFSGVEEKRFSIHEITGDTLTLYDNNRYYATSPALQYSTEAIGEARVTVDYDSLQKQATLISNQQDTLLAAGRLNDAFGMRVFDAIKAGLPAAIFKAQIRGLALIPAADNPGILGMNVVSPSGQVSRVFLHYHTLDDGGAVKDTLARALGVDYASFTKIEAERTGTELDAMQPYENIEPLSGLRYLQSGAPVITKLDLAPFYSFADTVDNILINSAEFVIENVEAPAGLKPPSTLIFRLMNNNSDQFLNTRVAADVNLLTQWRYFIVSSDNYYSPSSDGSAIAPIGYNEDESRYSGFITLFAQRLFLNKDDEDGINDNRLKYLALFPVNPQAARSVSRTVFSKDDVKLRIFYTRANPVTP